MKKTTHRRFYFCMSFLLPASILCGIYLFLRIAPFGDNNLMVSDLKSQYIPFFNHLKEILTGNASPFYDFNQTMGDNFLPLAAYYCMSPFNLLFLLGKNENMDILVHMVILLKIATISSSMYFYLVHKFSVKKHFLLIFSMCYAFSGFVGIYSINVMWLDGLLMLPIVVHFLEKMLRSGKGVGYAVSLALSIVLNYYMGYMICLFSLLLFLYHLFLEKDSQFKKDYFLKNKKRIFQFLSYSLLGAGMSFGILFPAGLGMMRTGKSSFHLWPFAPVPNFSFSFLTQLGMENTSFQSRLGHLPSFYVGAFVVLLVGLYFSGNLFSKREKKMKLFLFGGLFLSFWLQTFHTIWHMFQSTAGFPYRNSFILSFLLVVTAIEVWERKERVLKKDVLRSSVVLVSLLVFGYVWTIVVRPLHIPTIIQNYSTLSLKVFLVSLLFFGLGAYLTVKSLQNKRFITVLFFLLAVDVTFNLGNMFSTIPFESHERFAEIETQQEKSIKKVREAEKSSFYRVVNHLPTIDNGYNQSVMNDYYGIASYSSTLNDGLRKTLMSLGLYSKNERRISDIGLTDFTKYLLDVQVVVPKEEDGKIVVANSPQASIGYAVNKEIVNVAFTQNQPIQLQNQMAKIFMEDPNFSLFETPEATKESESIVKIKVKDDGHLYFYSPKNDNGKIVSTVYVNGQKIQPKIPFTQNQALLDLGEYQKGDRIELQVPTLEDFAKIKGHIFFLKEEQQHLLAGKLSQNRLEATFQKKNPSFQGNITAEKGQVLFTSIPYHSFWQVTVDGKKAKTFPVLNETFLGVQLKEGKHRIKISYTPYDFYIGIVVTLFSTLLLVIDSRRRSKKIESSSRKK